MKKTKISDCQIINIEQIDKDKAHFSVIENDLIPFDVKRVYYLYDIPSGQDRGEHAHIRLEQLIVAVRESFDIIVDDGLNNKKFTLNHPGIGLYLPPGLWRKITHFSPGAICLVLASRTYDETDYFRNYDDFKMYKKP